MVLYIMSIRACNVLAQRSMTLDNTGNKYRALCMVYKSGPQPGAIVPPRKHLPKSGDTFGCHSGWEWVGRGQKKLLKSLQCTGQPRQQKLSGSNYSGTDIKKRWFTWANVIWSLSRIHSWIHSTFPFGSKWVFCSYIGDVALLFFPCLKYSHPRYAHFILFGHPNITTLDPGDSVCIVPESGPHTMNCGHTMNSPRVCPAAPLWLGD